MPLPPFTTYTPPATFTRPGRVNQTVYNVVNYGAKGDGSTDDYTSLQNTLTAAGNAGGGTVFLPKLTGFYKTSSVLNIPSNVDVCGDNDLPTIKLANASNTYVFSNSDIVGGNSNITIQNLIIDGNVSGQSGGWDNINFTNVTNSYLENVTIQNSSGVGLSLNTCDNVKSRKLYITSNTNAGYLLTTCTNCVLDDSYSTYNNFCVRLPTTSN
jgi:polygalacturonase